MARELLEMQLLLFPDLIMIKQLIALTAGALFSLNASAGYVRYNLQAGASGGLSGYIIQHDTDHSIADFAFLLSDLDTGFAENFAPAEGDGAVLLTKAWTSFPTGGPTSFKIEHTYGGDRSITLQVDFGSAIGGLFAYTAHYVADMYMHQPPEFHVGTVSGNAAAGSVTPFEAAGLDSQGGYANGVPIIVPMLVDPAAVPEPGTIALLTLGMAGLAGAVRRRNWLA